MTNAPPVEIAAWARRHHVGLDALGELAAILGASALPPPTTSTDSEARVQSLVRLAAPSRGMMLFRNNVGVLTNERGVPVRYGLANDSKALNANLKSSDLIGWRTLTITPEMVGKGVAQFVSIECKEASWRRRAGDEHEAAQERWLTLVNSHGGYGKFVTSAGDL